MHLLLQQANPNSNASTTLPIIHKPHTPHFKLVHIQNSIKMLILYQLSSKLGLKPHSFIFSDKFHMLHILTKCPKGTHIIFPCPNFFQLTPKPKSQPKRHLFCKIPQTVMKSLSLCLKNLKTHYPHIMAQRTLCTLHIHHIKDVPTLGFHPKPLKFQMTNENFNFQILPKPSDRSHTIVFLTKTPT